jgi:hypothetical protein
VRLAPGAPTAQAMVQKGDRSLPTSVPGSIRSTSAALKARRLRAQYLLAGVWKVHGPGGVAPGDRTG